MTQKARGGMGSHKHGVSGRSPKSPKLRLAMRLDAERKPAAQPKGREMKPTIDVLFHPGNSK